MELQELKLHAENGAANACHDLGHAGDVGYVDDERINGSLEALARVVVDELIRLKNMGKTPKEIEAIYTDRTLPTIPEGPRRRWRRQKGVL